MAIILENVRIAFVNVIEPAENLSGQLKYSAQVRISKDDKANIERAREAIEKAIAKGKATKWGGKKPKFRYEPLRDGDKEIELGEQEDKTLAGHYFFSASKDPRYGKPGVVDENLQPILDADKLYSGCYVNIDVNPFPFDSNGNKGIGWGLANLMFVEDGDRLDGQRSAADAFGSLAPKSAEEANDTDFDDNDTDFDDNDIPF